MRMKPKPAAAPSRDPLHALAEILEQTLADYHFLDELKLAPENAVEIGRQCDAQMRCLCIREEGLKTAISTLPARDLAGALIHARLVFACLDGMKWPDVEGAGYEQKRIEEARLSALAIVLALETLGDIPREKWGGQEFISPDEGRIAGIEAARIGKGGKL